MNVKNPDATPGVPGPPVTIGLPYAPSGSQWGEVHELLAQLHAANEGEATSNGESEGPLPSRLADSLTLANHLVGVRLGIAGGLFAALKAKDGATAAHSYRVAIYCSNWAKRRGDSSAERDALEVAALLHDVGKIGVPDRVLLKPGALWLDEALVMERHQAIGLEILRSCCSSPAVLEIVSHAFTWYDGSHGKADCVGDKLPLGARMLAIANAFDAMTTDQVYRRAMSHELAIAELFHCSGTQFDPDLVREFAESTTWDVDKLVRDVERDWLVSLNPSQANHQWRTHAADSGNGASPDAPFRQSLPEQITDAVVFIDKELRVLLWNRGAERLTGLSGASMRGRHWKPAAIAMQDAQRVPITDNNCPVAHAIATGQPSVRRAQIKGRSRRRISVDVHVTPVTRSNGHVEGATLVMHDVSPEISLESALSEFA